jgi:hypothetical protein
MTTTTTDTRPARCRTCARCKKDPEWPIVDYPFGSGYLCIKDEANAVRNIIYAYQPQHDWPNTFGCPYYVAQEA